MQSIPVIAESMIDLLAPILELQDCSHAVFCPERVALDRNERMAVAGSEVQEPAAIWDNHDETEGQGEREDLLVVPVKAQRFKLYIIVCLV